MNATDLATLVVFGALLVFALVVGAAFMPAVLSVINGLPR